MSFFGDVFGSILDIGKSVVGSIPGVGSVAKDIVGAVTDPISNALGVSKEQKAQRNSQGFQLDYLAAQNAYAQDNMKLSHDFNIEDWQRNNEYNSPAAQRQRLSEAGLNPLLADVGGSLSSAVTTSSAGAPSGTSSDLGALASMISAQSSADLAKSQARLNDAEAEKVATDNELAKEDLKTRGATNQATLDNLRANKNLTESQIEKISFEIDKIQRDCDYILEQTRGEKQRNDFTDETWDLAVDRLVAEVNCTKSQASSYLAAAVASRSVAQLNNETTAFLTDTHNYRVGQEKWKEGQELRKYSGLYWDNESKSLHVQSDAEFLELERSLGSAGKILKIVSNLVK